VIAWRAQWLLEINDFHERDLIKMRQQKRRPAKSGIPGRKGGLFSGGDPARRQNPVHGRISMQSQPDLLQLIPALGAARGFARLLHSRQQQGHENSNERKNDDQLDKCESALRSGPDHIWSF